MARKYSRDKNGRFASSSAGGATARGSRLGGKGGGPAARASGVSAPQGTIARGSVNRSVAAVRGMGKGTTVKGAAAGAAKPAAKASPTAAAKPAKMSKAPANKAKAAYKSATSQVRELKMYRGGKSDKTVKSAQAKVKRMESKRGVTGRKK